MKKTLSVFLAALMLMLCIPFTAFADSPVYLTSQTITSSAGFSGGNEFIIGNGVHVTLDSNDIHMNNNTKITIQSGGSLTANSKLHLYDGDSVEVLQGGTLTIGISGRIIMESQSATMTVYGTLVNGQNITYNNNDWITNVRTFIRFPNLQDAGLMNTDNTPKVSLNISIKKTLETSESIFDELTGSLKWNSPSDLPVSDGTGDDGFINLSENIYYDKVYSIPSTGAVICVPLNTLFYIKPTFNTDNARKYDPSLFHIYLDGVEIGNFSGICHTTIVKSGNITYSPWSKDGEAYYKTYKIALPEEREGYTIVNKYGEEIEDVSLTAKYGDYFTFKVQLEEEYDMSVPEVFIYNGYGWVKIAYNVVDAVEENKEDELIVASDTEPEDTVVDNPLSTIIPDAAAQPDEYGYYTIKVEGEVTVYVYGLVKNSTITSIGNILDTVKSVVSLIRDFFGDFFKDIKEVFDSFNLKDLVSGLIPTTQPADDTENATEAAENVGA